MTRKLMQEIGWMGTAVAAVISYCQWHLFWYAVGHGLLGWVYVFYYWWTKGRF